MARDFVIVGAGSARCMLTRQPAERRPCACHPDEPHWYLPMIGVEPTRQGRGHGAALLRHQLARCDAEGTLAYLESSNPRNIALYLRHGFEITGEIQVGSSPVMTPMLRRPR